MTPVDRGQDRVEAVSQKGGKQKMGSQDAQVYKVIDPPFWLKKEDWYVQIVLGWVALVVAEN